MTKSSAAKKCILFVDDEPHVLNALRRMLHSRREQWDMLFVPSGAHAFAQVIDRKIDVIISDMRMPHMDGSELLRRVSQISPGTVRIVLSGQASDKPMVDVVHYAHQYLAKPCEADHLIGTIERACILHDLLARSRLQQLVARLETLPSMPDLYRQVHQELASEDASLHRVGAIIEQDPAMSGKILQMVNSAFFATARKVSQPTEAVTMLGLETIGNLVLTAGIFNQVDPKIYREFQLERLWLHTIHTSEIARRIASREHRPDLHQDSAATAGLLHDIGVLVLAGEKPTLYREVISIAQKEDLTLAQAEHRLLGTTHTEIGAYLLGLWGLPNEVILAIVHHVACNEEAEEEPTLACVLHVADILEQELSTPATPTRILELDRYALQRLGEKRLETWRRCAEGVMQMQAASIS